MMYLSNQQRPEGCYRLHELLVAIIGVAIVSFLDASPRLVSSSVTILPDPASRATGKKK
jgi:Ca2+/Na+ antiporter